jgi:HKD family nuclease
MALLFGPKKPALEWLRDVKRAIVIERGRIIVAWARLNGVGLLLDTLGPDLKKVQVIVGMAGSATSAEALAHLRRACQRVFLFHKHHLQTFHPKVYCFDDGGDPPDAAMLLVGSSNVTGGGLFSNFEANIGLRLSPGSSDTDALTFRSMVDAFDDLVAAAFCEEITTDERIRELLEDRYLSTEARLKRRAAEDATGAARHGSRRNKPEAPPPNLPRFDLPELPVTFSDPAPPVTGVGVTRPDLVTPPVAAGRFYVRTLTVNDVRKLVGLQVGTFEPDIGETARDAEPDFWGWPTRFVAVTRRDTRQEWAATAEVRSAATGSKRVDAEFMQWYRPARPADLSTGRIAHAAEHRIRIGPISRLREAVPVGFDTHGLMVIERLPNDAAHDFLVMLLRPSDPEFADYEGYLSHQRPNHRFGYGLTSALEA